MKIIIDAMGGDNAPQAIVEGAVNAQKEFGIDIVLVGREEDVNACLAPLGARGDPHIRVVNADEVIDMHDDPATAVRRKKNSSMSVALELLRSGEGDAAISAGSVVAVPAFPTTMPAAWFEMRAASRSVAPSEKWERSASPSAFSRTISPPAAATSPPGSGKSRMPRRRHTGS